MYKTYQQQIVEYGMKILNSQYVAGTSGNISLRIGDENTFAISPSGVPYDVMKPQDVPILDLSGRLVYGELKPSIEWRMHAQIYQEYPSVKAVIHTHSIYTTALSLIRTPLPGITETLLLIGKTIPIAEYANAGTKKLAENVVKALRNSRAAILANHGLVCTAESLESAFKMCETIERNAKIFTIALSTGKPIHVIPKEEAEAAVKWLKENYGQK